MAGALRGHLGVESEAGDRSRIHVEEREQRRCCDETESGTANEERQE
jgi:hypothetical protein